MVKSKPLSSSSPESISSIKLKLKLGAIIGIQIPEDLQVELVPELTLVGDATLVDSGLLGGQIQILP